MRGNLDRINVDLQRLHRAGTVRDHGPAELTIDIAQPEADAYTYSNKL